MTTLKHLHDNNYYLTDKGTTHNYLEPYHDFFRSRRESAEKVLEIGTGLYGGSLLLWRDYFKNAEILGVDHNTWVDDPNSCFKKLVGEERVTLLHRDAYNVPVINEKYDVIIDDGSHKAHHQKLAVELYLPLIADDGIFAIEDIADAETLEMLYNAVPDDLKPYTHKVDMATVTGRFDDRMLFVDMTRPCLETGSTG